METVAQQRLFEKIKKLPDSLMEDISDFVDFLAFKKDKDWAESLTIDQRKSIEEGRKDIENGDFYSHESVMEELAEYRKSKQK